MKSKIEEKIKNAREATNEMFAAFEELNERLSKNVIEVSINAKRRSLNIPPINCDCWIEKWMPERGEYATTVGLGGEKLIVIFKKWKDSELFFHYAGLNTYGKLTIGTPFGFLRGDIIRPATPEEIALLDSRLAEQGKGFDKEKLELVDIEKEVRKCATCYFCKIGGLEKPCITCTSVHDSWQPIPKHKEPVIGRLAITWHDKREFATIAILESIDGSNYPYCVGKSWYKNAILFESPEQYKAFLKS